MDTVSSSSSTRTLDLLPMLCLLIMVAAASASDQEPQHTDDGASPPLAVAVGRPAAVCPKSEKCGNVILPYPFGTMEGCFRPGFRVICNHNFDPPRAFIDPDLQLPLGSMPDDSVKNQIEVRDYEYFTNKDWPDRHKRNVWPIELVGVSVSEGKAQMLRAFSYDCSLNITHRSARRQQIMFGSSRPRQTDRVYRSPFRLSHEDNALIGIGNYIVAEQSVGANCQSYVPIPMRKRNNTGNGAPVNGSCSGQGCCHSNLPAGLNLIVSDVWIPKPGYAYRKGRVSCSYAMIVDKSWYNFSSLDLDNDAFLHRNAARGVPVVVDFNIATGGCPKPGEPTPKDFACVSNNSSCFERFPLSTTPYTNDSAHYCSCSVGYYGNPYIQGQGGCQDIDECSQPDQYPCYGKCENTPGHYKCTCPAGTRGNATQAPCTDLFPLPAKISVGVVGGLFIIALLVFVVLIRNEKTKMAERFKKNGGPTLEKAKIIKIYKKEELNPILMKSNFIGRGAFGEVYKGFLDHQLVAVKKPIDGNMAQNDQFSNEVIIQSQVIHKNIVKLIGCCLEVDKPMLVYEYLSNGSLDDILHGSSGDPLTLEQRLNIAAESAEGLAYMHSKTGKIILHGDVKPANILLNDCFTPKISDFGISRLILMDKELTDHIIGDRTYMDPVYLRDGILTDKSDVYSFGVVLLELISRKKATYSDNNSLLRSFLDAHKNQKEATELFDKEITKPEVLTIINSLYEIAVSCLNLDVDERPSMAHVEMCLHKLKGDLCMINRQVICMQVD